MADPTLFTTHVSKGLNRLLSQFKGQPNFEGQLKSFLIQVQEIEAMLHSLVVDRYLDTAEGAQLDGIGRIVGEGRLGRSDLDYRAAIKGRIRVNLGDGRVEDIHFLFSLLLPAHTFELVRGAVLEFLYIVNEAVVLGVDPSPDALSAQLTKVRGGGTRSTLIWSVADQANSFTTASGTTLEASTTQGTTDPAMSSGGTLAGALLS